LCLLSLILSIPVFVSVSRAPSPSCHAFLHELVTFVRFPLLALAHDKRSNPGGGAGAPAHVTASHILVKHSGSRNPSASPHPRSARALAGHPAPANPPIFEFTLHSIDQTVSLLRELDLKSETRARAFARAQSDRPGPAAASWRDPQGLEISKRSAEEVGAQSPPDTRRPCLDALHARTFAAVHQSNLSTHAAADIRGRRVLTHAAAVC
jgi:hypothetical protein